MGPFAQLLLIALAFLCLLIPLPALADDIIAQRLDEEEIIIENEGKIMQQQDVMSFDVVVYGGTPSGIMAAIAGKRWNWDDNIEVFFIEFENSQ
jgi:hypothetical protein